MAVNLNVISQFDAKGLNRAQSELDKLAASTSSMSTKLAGAAKVAGAGILVGAGAVAAGLFAIGSSFDEAFDNIRIGTGATGPVLEGLQNDMKAVAGAVPASFGDAGKAVTVFSQKLGLTGAPLQTLSSQVLELSRMTGTDLGGNLTAVTDVFNNFGVGAGEQSGKLDLLFRASQASGVSVAELAGTMSGAGVVLREVGLSFDQSAGFLATLAKAGVDAGDVMPALSKSLATAAKQGKDASSVFTDTFNAIKGAPDDVAASGIALDVFGAKAGPKLAALIREGKLSYEEMTAAIAGGGETILGASADTQDFAEKLTMLKNRVFLAIEPIATKVFNAIGEAMDKLGPKVDEVSDFFSRHMDVVKQVAFVIGTLAVIAIGAYTYAMIQAAIATVLALSPIYLIIAAVVAVVAVLLVVWNNWDTIWKWIMEHKAYAAIIAILAGPIVIPILAIVGIIKWLQANWETVWSVIQTVTNIAVSVTVTYFKALIEYVKFMWNIFQILSDVVQNVFSAIVRAISGAWGFISGVFDTIKGGIFDLVMFFLGIPGYIGGIGAGIANAIGDGFKAAWNTIAGLINRAIPDSIGFGYGPEINVPDNPVPTFAKGGIFNAAMNGGSGLAVLHDNEMILNADQQKGLFAGRGIGGGSVININVEVSATADKAAVGQTIVEAIAAYERRAGDSWRAA
jgi:TP901 family phage tail tape measure protein